MITKILRFIAQNFQIKMDDWDRRVKKSNRLSIYKNI